MGQMTGLSVSFMAAHISMGATTDGSCHSLGTTGHVDLKTLDISENNRTINPAKVLVFLQANWYMGAANGDPYKNGDWIAGLLQYQFRFSGDSCKPKSAA